MLRVEEGETSSFNSQDPWWYQIRTSVTSSSSEKQEVLLDSTLPDPEYYDVGYRIVGTLLIGVIFLIGLTGNAMVVLVVWSCRSMHTPTNCYLVSLAVADLILLFWGSLPTLVEYNLVVDQHVLGPVGCSVMVFMQYFGVNASSLSITALTVERYIAICHPMMAQTICTITRAKRILVGLWIVGLAYSAPWLALATTVWRTYADGTQIEFCTYRLPRRDYLIYYLADLVLMYAVPLAVNTVLYGLIARALYTNTVAAANGARGTGLSVQQSPSLAGVRFSNSSASQQLPQRNGKMTARLMKSTSTISSRIQVLCESRLLHKY